MTSIETVAEDLNRPSNDQPFFATPEKKSAFKLKVPPSPVMRPNKQNTKEKQLIEWANKALSNTDPPIKITNLNTSWQNGLGFCALLRKHFPTLIPPSNQLKTDQRNQNCQLAIEAAALVGIETATIISNEGKEDLVIDKNVVKILLQELKTTFQNIETVELSEKDVIAFQCHWYKTAGFFAEYAVQIIEKEKLDIKMAEEIVKLAEIAEKDRLLKEKLSQEREDTRNKLYENGKQFDLDQKSRRINEVQDLIKEAHNSVQVGADISPNIVSTDMPDNEETICNLTKINPDKEQVSPDSEPTSSTSTTQDYQSASKDVSLNSGFMLKITLELQG